MKLRPKRLKTAARMMLALGLSTLLSLFVAAIGSWQMHSLSAQLDAIATDQLVKVELFSGFKDDINTMARMARDVLIVDRPAYKLEEVERLRKLRSDNEALFARLRRAASDEEAEALMKRIDEMRPIYDKLLDDAIELDRKGETRDAGTLLILDLKPKQDVIFKAVDELVRLQRERTTQAAREAKTNTAGAAVILVGVALAGMLIGAVVIGLLTRSLTRSLGAEPAELCDAARRVAAGDLASLATARTAPQGSVVDSLSHMRESLASIVARVRSGSDSIATGSAQIAAGNLDLSQRTEIQASQLQKTASAMGQIAEAIGTTAAVAGEADLMAKRASALAVSGGELVGKVVSTMHEISSASKHIGEITGVIDAIASQTNILALNAAAEAARAGDLGRGFGAVATEVRNLAQRSASAAKEIRGLIVGNVDKVKAGAQQVNEARASMSAIVAQVQQVSEAIHRISSATREQSSSASEVGDAVGQLDRSTQQNAALVEQTAAAAESLKQQAARLAEVVSVFRLSDEVRGFVSTGG